MKARIEDVAAAETLARTANVFGSWKAYESARPARKWVRGAASWTSYDPVIQRQIERKAAREAAEKAKAATETN